MRILMLSQSYAPVTGGVERIVEDLSGELVRRGHEVAVATLRQPTGAPPRPDDGVELHLLGTSVHRLPGIRFDSERRHAPPSPDPVTVLELGRLVRRWRPDIVHAHDWLVYSYLPLARRRAAPGLVLSMHDYGLVCAIRRFLHKGSVCSGPGWRKCIDCARQPFNFGAVKGPAVALGVRSWERRTRRDIDVFLPVSGAVAAGCRLGDDEESEVIPNFIGDLPDAPAGADEVLAALPAEPFLLYLGDVTLDKGVGVLLRAYRRLDSPPPLVLVGRAFLEEVHSCPGVHALGPLPHDVAIEAVRRSLFTVVPSVLPEAFGLVALEASAAGKPVVASQLGGLPDIIVDQDTGLLVPAKDVDALAAAMARLLADPELRGAMGGRARGRAAQFSADAVVPRFEAAYQRALDARRAAVTAAAR